MKTTSKYKAVNLIGNANSDSAHGRGRPRRGQAMIEMALVVSVLLVLTMGIIQYGIIYNATISLTNIARDGARYAAVKCALTEGSDDNIRAYMRTAAANTSVRPELLNISITPAARVGGQKLTVNVSYDLRTKLFLPTSFPGLGRYSTSYSTTATMLCEG